MFKKGDKVRIKKLTLQLVRDGFKAGQEVEITASVFDGTKSGGFDLEINNYYFCNSKNVESIVNISKNEQRISTLEKEVELLKNELIELKNQLTTKFDFNKCVKRLAEEIGQKKLHSQNEERKKIIEQAKKFVGENSNYYSMTMEPNNPVAKKHLYETEFIFQNNRIIALVFKLNIDNKRCNKQPIYAGQAIKNEVDVFNEHIGKAIALGRALKLDVSKFENAVQPMEIVVGHKVSSILTGTVYEITSIVDNELRIYHSEKYWPKNSLNDGKIKIIDDTNAKY